MRVTIQKRTHLVIGKSFVVCVDGIPQKVCKSGTIENSQDATHFKTKEAAQKVVKKLKAEYLCTTR